jgi:hypothetical protein
MDLKVVGAGFGRTGTLSLKAALEQLGVGPCYHMMEVFRNPGHVEGWLAFAKGESKDITPLLENFHSVVDWPTTYVWRELYDASPKAKVILTERDPEVWYKSATDTIFRHMGNLRADLDPMRHMQGEMATILVKDKTFGGDLGKDNAIAVYKRHNEEVKRTVPKDRLLVYKGEDGWGPLCEFLGVPVPSAPYPKTNTTEEFQARVQQRA